MTTLPKCPRPTSPGTYVIRRSYPPNTPALAFIYVRNGVLTIVFGISVFPLSELEDTAEFWGPLELE